MSMSSITRKTQSVRKVWLGKTHGGGSAQDWSLVWSRSHQEGRELLCPESHMKERFKGEKIEIVSWEQEILPFCWIMESTEVRPRLRNWKKWSDHIGTSHKSQEALVLRTSGAGESGMVFEQRKKPSNCPLENSVYSGGRISGTSA